MPVRHRSGILHGGVLAGTAGALLLAACGASRPPPVVASPPVLAAPAAAVAVAPLPSTRATSSAVSTPLLSGPASLALPSLSTDATAGATARTTLAPPPPPAPRTEPAPPARFTSLPAGTRLTYQRRESGSFGRGESGLQVRVGQTTWQGKPMVSYARERGLTDLHEPGTGKLAAVMQGRNQPAIVYDPPLGYETPLAVGKTWTARSKVTTTSPRRVAPVEVRYTVQALDDVTVAAGTFLAWRIRVQDASGDEHRVWISADHGLTLKRSLRRAAGHPLGAGARETELLAWELPRPHGPARQTAARK